MGAHQFGSIADALPAERRAFPHETVLQEQKPRLEADQLPENLPLKVIVRTPVA
jgi:hypothetical protein